MRIRSTIDAVSSWGTAEEGLRASEVRPRWFDPGEGLGTRHKMTDIFRQPELGVAVREELVFVGRKDLQAGQAIERLAGIGDPKVGNSWP